MGDRGSRWGVLLAGTALGGWLAATPVAAAPSALVAQGPAEFSTLAAEIGARSDELLAPALRLAGLARAGAPIRVVLAPESSPVARGTPRWVAGFADEPAGVVVLFPARVSRYPDRGVEALVRHEAMHVLAYRAAGGRPLPRWFDEGMAMAAGRESDVGDRARVAFAVLTDARLPLARIDAAFAGNTAEVTEAYALARDFVGALLRESGSDVGARILSAVARGASFGDAFRGATGRSLAETEAAYWRQRTFWDRWVPVATSSVTLWGAITGLALIAFRRRSVRDDRIRQRWEREEIEDEVERSGGPDPDDEEELVN